MNAYSPDFRKMPLSAIFYALGDPVRLQIVLTLLEQKEISCGACKTRVSKSTMSHHFKVLRQAGLIQKREEGTVHYLSLKRSDITSRLPALLKLLEKATGPL